MRVAALYDIHGNLPALDAVLADVAAVGCDAVVVGGDVVPGPMPGGCLERFRGLSVPVHRIRGNGEADVVAARRGAPLERVPEAFHPVLHWVAEVLDESQLADLATWHPTVRLEVPGLGRVLFCHATPRDDNELFTKNTPEDRLRPVLERSDADVVVCGHTHMPFDRRVGRTRVLNAGSVGMPFGDTGAFWLLLGDGVPELRRTEYDLEWAQAEIDASGYPFDVDLRHPPPEGEMIEMFEAAALRAGP